MTDTQRIDWLEQAHEGILCSITFDHYREWYVPGSYQQTAARSIRDAIDKAILQDQINLAHEEGKLHMEMELKKQLNELSTK